MGEITKWPMRQWGAALVAAVVVAFAIGLPSDVLPNPVFARPIDVTWWSYPMLVVTAVLGGALVATYFRGDRPARGGGDAGDGDLDGDLDDDLDDERDVPGRVGGAGGLLSFFAIGCPTCNKLVVVAIGTTGALDWFAPAQPLLAILSIALLAWALQARLRATAACPIPA